jgi:predicted NAD/FAD-binding protein
MYSLNPRLYRMIFDVLRFNLFALDILKEEGMDDMSIGEYLDREGYGDGFKEDYLLVCPFLSGHEKKS